MVLVGFLVTLVGSDGARSSGNFCIPRVLDSFELMG